MGSCGGGLRKPDPLFDRILQGLMKKVARAREPVCVQALFFNSDTGWSPKEPETMEWLVD